MNRLYNQIREIPLFDTHMHASSIASVGTPRPDGFETDFTPGCPAGETTLLTLLDAPYMLGNHRATGLYRPSGADDFATRWEEHLPALNVERGTGLFIALDTALADLYGIPLTQAMHEGTETAWELSQRIASKYARGLFEWSAEAMHRAGIIGALKPVHALYIKAVADRQARADYGKERALYTPILRTDDFFGRVDPAGNLRFTQLESAVGERIESLSTLEQAIDEIFACVREIESPCVKQAQAYDRSLNFIMRTRGEAEAAFCAAAYGDRNAASVVQDYVMEKILHRGMKYQIHTGVANLGNTSPVLLRGAIERHPEVQFVLLHGYPYLSEAINLTRFYENVYFDLSWLQLLSPSIMMAALREAIGFVPMNKLFLSTDATSPEEQYGAAVGLRRTLASVLEERMGTLGWNEELSMDVAHALLHRNAESFYD